MKADYLRQKKRIQELEHRLEKEEEANLRAEVDRSEYVIRLQNVEETKKNK